jgi:hypothetical protein
MRIGAALEALDHTLSEITTLDPRQRLLTYGAVQAIAERLRAIARARGLSSSIINAQLLKIQFSTEALAGLGGGRQSDEGHLGDIRAALEALRGADCFGYNLDEVE